MYVELCFRSWVAEPSPRTCGLHVVTAFQRAQWRGREGVPGWRLGQTHLSQLVEGAGRYFAFVLFLPMPANSD